MREIPGYVKVVQAATLSLSVIGLLIILTTLLTWAEWQPLFGYCVFGSSFGSFVWITLRHYDTSVRKQ